MSSLLKQCSALLLCASIINTAYAETEQLFVTAQRFPVDINKTLSSITVIDREQINASPAADLPSLLAQTPSFAISRAGGPGQQTSLFVRGTESDHFLLLVDGVRVATATSGAAALNLIPLESIERIEIVRGPRSSLYGSEALGGVIQIVTKNTGETSTPHFSLEAGSNNTWNARAGYRWVNDNTRLAINLGITDSEGIDALVGSDPDKDGHANTSVSLNLDHRFSDELRLESTILHATGNQEFDDSFDATAKPENDFVQQAASIAFLFQPSNDLELGITFAQGLDELEVDSNFSNFFNTTTDQLNLSAKYSQPGYTLLAGFDYRDEELESQTAYQESSRDNQAFYLNYLGQSGSHSFGASLRSDDNQAFGSETTGNISYAFTFANNLQVSLAAGTAYKAPSFNDLYFPDFAPFFFSNPDLTPEKSENIELSVAANSNHSNWKISIFQNEIEDLISFTGLTSENIAEAKIQGLELSLSTNLAGWNLMANASLLDHEDQQSGEPLLRRPDTTINLSSSRQFGAWTPQLDINYSDSRTDLDFSSFPSSIVTLDDFVLVNLGVNYQLNDRWSVYAKVNNLFDQDYTTIQGFNQPGIESLIGVRFR